MRWPLAAVACSFALFAAIAAVAGGGPLGWDSAIADAVASAAPLASSDVHVDPFMQAVNVAVGALTFGFGIWLVVRRQFRAAVFLAGSIGGAVALSMVAKTLVERPPIEGPTHEFSFPSGSAAWSMANAAAVLLLARSRRELPLLIAVAAVLVLGLAAVIVWEEWHYPSDVLAGWCVGLGWTVALWVALGRPSVDTSGRLDRYSVSNQEERSAAAPSVPAAKRTGGTGTSA